MLAMLGLKGAMVLMRAIRRLSLRPVAAFMLANCGMSTSKVRMITWPSSISNSGSLPNG